MFRVDSLDIATNAVPTTDLLHNAFDIVPDDFPADYSGIAPDTDPARLVGSARLFLSLYQQMANSPPGKGDTLFFLHGFNYSWPDALSHLLRLHRLYVEPPQSPIGQILYFTWPSWGQYGRYLSDQRIAQPSGALLGRVFGKAVQFYRDFFSPEDGSAPFCGRKIHFAAHSMGNLVMQEFMRSIWEYDYLRMPLFGEVLLLHADADWNALEPEQPLHELPDYSQRIHVYNHASDDALAISETTKNDRKRLGRHGPRDLALVPPRMIVTDCSRLNGNVAVPQNAPTDVTAAAGAIAFANGESFDPVSGRILGQASARERLFDHWGYLHRPEEVADIYRVLRGVSSAKIDGRDHVHDQLYRLRAIA